MIVGLALIGMVSSSLACSSEGDDAPGMNGGAGGMTGGAGGATGGVGGNSGVGGATGGASGAAGMTGGMTGMTGGAGGMAGGVGGMTGGMGGMTGGAGGMAGGAAVTECNGMMLPARAIRSATPHMIGPVAHGLPDYSPTAGWQSMAPDALGLDATKLDAAINFSTATSNTQAVMVIRHGYVAAEEYFGGTTASTRHESYSMAKSFSSALIGIAIEQGLITGTDEKLCKFYPTYWDCADTSDLRSKITIDHAMNIMTGLQWSENWASDATGPNDAITGSIGGMLETVLGREAVEEPGTRMRYSTGDPSLLSGVFESAAGKSALEYGREVLFTPLGITGIQWNSDFQGRTTTYAGLQGTAQEYAKFGLLFLNRGMWGGEQIVPAEWVDKTTQGDKPCEDWYRYLWHQNAPTRLGTQPADCDALFCPPTGYEDLPGDTYFAEGVNGQFIFIMPSVDMVVVRLASDGAGSENWDEYATGFLKLILDAVM
jgi:CubicO group peptidase (beta-lactamase class C family)